MLLAVKSNEKLLLSLYFCDAVYGVSIEINLKLQKPLPKCQIGKIASAFVKYCS